MNFIDIMYCSCCIFRLISIGESFLGIITQLVQVGDASEVDHGRRTTHHHQMVVGWGEQMVLDHLVVDETDTILPTYKERTIGSILIFPDPDSKTKFYLRTVGQQCTRP